MSTVLVTVGSTLFPSLTSAFTSASLLHTLSSLSYTSLIIQHGSAPPPSTPTNSTSIPIKITLHTYLPSHELYDLIASPDTGLIISHAGSGSILSALRAGKKLIVVPNEGLMDNHQVELAEVLEGEGFLVVASPETLEEAIKSLPNQTLKPFPPFKPERFASIMDEVAGYA